MDGVGGPRGYGAFTGPVAGDGRDGRDGSVSILRKASDTAKAETGLGVGEGGDRRVGGSERPNGGGEALVDLTDADAAAETSAASRPIGNLGHHLDLRL